MKNKHNGNSNLVLKMQLGNEQSIHKLVVYSKICSILRCVCVYLFLGSKNINLVSGSRKGTIFKIKSPEM